MALDGGYYGSHEHAMANLYIGRRQGREQGHEEGYKEGHADGYNQGYNQAMAEAQQHIQQLQAELNRQVTIGNMHVAFAAPARETLTTLIEENPDYAPYIRALFRDRYIAEVQDSLANQYLFVAPENDPASMQIMPRARQFILDAMAG